MSDQVAIIEGVRQAAKRREETAKARREATAELRRYCKQAQDAGIPVTQIAREAGLSRQGVYDLLAERPSS